MHTCNLHEKNSAILTLKPHMWVMEFYCICWKSPVIYGQGLHMPIKWMWTLREGWGQPEFTLAPNEMMLF